MRRLLSILFCIFSMLIIPLCAYAQPTPKPPRTAKDNFGGISFGGRIIFGAKPGDKDESLHNNAKPSSPYHLSESAWDYAGGLNFELSKLYGDELFIGPKFEASLNSPYFLTVALSAKLALPVTRSNAITMSVGVGYALLSLIVPFSFYQTKSVVKVKYIAPKPGWVSMDYKVSHPNEDYDDTFDLNFKDDTVPDRLYSLYFPVHVGYEHVFESGFTMGISAEMKIGFKSNRTEYYSMYREKDIRYHVHRGNEDKLGLTASFVGVGLYLGYSEL